MIRLTLSQVRNLIHKDDPPCVSLYVPLAHAVENGNLGGCYRNLLETAEKLLRTTYSEELTQIILDPLRKIKIKGLSDYETGTLVIFRSYFIEGYIIVPRSIAGNAVVSDSFHLKPLLEEFMPPKEFYVLSLNSDSAHLYLGDSSRFIKLHTFDLEVSDLRNVGHDDNRANSTLSNIERMILLNSLKVTDLFKNTFKLSFYKKIDRQLLSFLNGTSSPVILAASLSDAMKYASTTRCKNIKREYVSKAIDISNAESVQYVAEKAREISAEHFNDKKEAEKILIEKAKREEMFCTGFESVIKYLAEGKVDTLYVNRNEVIWGQINWFDKSFTKNPCQIDAKDDDLIDECIEKALRDEVRVIPFDDQVEVDAVFAILKKQKATEREFKKNYTKGLQATYLKKAVPS